MLEALSRAEEALGAEGDAQGAWRELLEQGADALGRAAERARGVGEGARARLRAAGEGLAAGVEAARGRIGESLSRNGEAGGLVERALRDVAVRGSASRRFFSGVAFPLSWRGECWPLAGSELRCCAAQRSGQPVRPRKARGLAG